jgi:prophage regulatory protein
VGVPAALTLVSIARPRNATAMHDPALNQSVPILKVGTDGWARPPEARGPHDERLLKIGEVMKLTGLGRTAIWELERRGEFPKRVKLSTRGRAVRWRASEVARWIAERTAAGEA